MAQLRKDAPPVLYKFRGDIERDVKCLLVDQHLFLPSPGALNDPFDCYPAIDLPPPEDRERLMEAEVAGAPPGLEAEVRRRCNLLLSSPLHRCRYLDEFYEKDLGRLGVLTLSASRDHPLLWAHYGASFAGFVVGYRARDEARYEALPAVPVKYTKVRHRMLPFGEDDWLGVLFTKSTHWGHEQEWRYVRMEDDGGHGMFSVPRDCILEVCLGPRMKPAQRDLVVRAARALPDSPQILQARLDPERFGLLFDDID